MKKTEIPSRKKFYLNETQSFTKLSNYLRSFVLDDVEFIRKLVAIRSRYGIPPQGFSPNEMGRSSTDYPKGWQYGASNSVLERFHEEVRMLCDEYALDPSHWASSVQFYIFFGFLVVLAKNHPDLIVVENYAEGFHSKLNNAYFPVAIRISPYASKRDIADYIERAYAAMILPIQRKARDTRVKIGKIRKRSWTVAERNLFIYKHKDLPFKKITELVYERFGKQIDQGYVGKIISQENKRRKQV